MRGAAERPPADRIRNVVLVGHRGAGKTSLHEALLFEAGATSRLGSVPDGSTVSDADPDEQARQMSISAALSSFEWQGRKINLLDTPGDPSFVADALGALRVCESAVFVINGVMGVEVSTTRLWARAGELDIARMLFVNMLDRERADFFRSLEQLKGAFGAHVVATEIPIGSEHDLQGVIDLVDMKAFRQDSAEPGGWSEMPIPDAEAELAADYREKLMDEVSEVSDALMERYLEGEEISHEEIVGALKDGTNHGKIFPVVCGVATRNLGTSRLLDAIVEDLPSPVKHGSLQVGDIELTASEDAELFAYVFKTRADPFAGRINLLRVYQGVMSGDSQVLNTRAHAKERIGQLLVFAGKEVTHVSEFGPGDIGAVAKLKETRAGDWLAARDEPIAMPRLKLPAPVMAFAVEPKSRGDEDKVLSSLRRLQEEDPTIDLHRDQQTGEQIVAGLSQVHVEVIVDRLRERFGVQVTLKPPRVPYQETIRRPAAGHGRHKKQSGGRGQFGDCQISIEPLGASADHGGFEFVNQIKGGVSPTSFIPAVEKGVREAMDTGVLAGYPVQGVRVRLFDGQYHSVDSSEIAFK
ncbi:MAG: translation elongation factor, partial [Solirubrobacterales bacterium]|nr:translation elongation factor [Solirubrobacterales bacterium]